MNSTSRAICSSSYGLLSGAAENWRESKTAPLNINIFILLSSLTAPGRANHAYSINKRHAQCTQVSVSFHTHPQIPWQKLFVLTRACKRSSEKTNEHGQRWRGEKEMFLEAREKKTGWRKTNNEAKKKEYKLLCTWAHTHRRTCQSWAPPGHLKMLMIVVSGRDLPRLLHRLGSMIREKIKTFTSFKAQCWIWWRDPVCSSCKPSDILAIFGSFHPG